MSVSAADNVFIDVDSIEIGADFAQVIGDRVGRCDALLAVIGRGWADARDDGGNRRLDAADDYVRLEIEAALRRSVRVVPVLIHGTRMPIPADLPPSLAPLLTRNAIELTRKYWELDVQELVAALERFAGAAAARQTAVGPGPGEELSASEPTTTVAAAPETAAPETAEAEDAEPETAEPELAASGPEDDAARPAVPEPAVPQPEDVRPQSEEVRPQPEAVVDPRRPSPKRWDRNRWRRSDAPLSAGHRGSTAEFRSRWAAARQCWW